MAFAATILCEGPIPDKDNAKETYSYANTSGSTGGTVTAKWLSRITRIEGTGILTRTISGRTVTIVTDVNANGNIDLYGPC